MSNLSIYNSRVSARTQSEGGWPELTSLGTRCMVTSIGQLSESCHELTKLEVDASGGTQKTSNYRRNHFDVTAGMGCEAGTSARFSTS